jgi:hypothetical protein
LVLPDSSQAVILDSDRPTISSGGHAKPFSEGLAAACPGIPPSGKRGHVYGHIDKIGVFRIQPQYVMAEPFKNGIALVLRKAFQF